MIPAFIAPHYARPDLTDRMLASIDVPVGVGLVVDNSCSGYRPNVGPEWRVFEPPFGSMGLPGSLNFAIGQMYDAPWWLWASNDLVFAPGDLAAIAAFMDSYEGRPIVTTYRMAFVAFNRAVIDTVGLFDEWSYWPLYFDDTDWARRCALADIPMVNDKRGIVEGADGFDHSMTIRDEKLGHANNRSWALNKAAYVAKWGGLPGSEVFDSPWDLGLPLWAMRPDLDGRGRRAW